MTETIRIAPQTMIGEVQLSVANLERSLDFYQQTLGFQRLGYAGSQAGLGVGGKRLVVLNEKPGARPVEHVTGLYHLAVLLPNRRSLARLIYHLVEKEIEVTGAADHGVSEALYLSDPDGNGIDLYADRHKNDWPRDDIGRLQMGTEELDIEDLVLELKGRLSAWDGLPSGTVIGHIHLHVADLAITEHFYRQILGLNLTQRYAAGALFFAAGEYHHHIGANIWAGVGAPPPPPDAAGLRWFELLLPGKEALQAILERLQTNGIPSETQGGGTLVRDPAGNGILLKSV